MLLGQGLMPESYEPAAEALDADWISDALDKMRESYRRMAEHMPSHGEFIARTCPAQAPTALVERG